MTQTTKTTTFLVDPEAHEAKFAAARKAAADEEVRGALNILDALIANEDETHKGLPGCVGRPLFTLDEIRAKLARLL